MSKITKTYPVAGTSCAGCANHVQTALASLPGVEAAVDLAKKSVKISYDPDQTPEEDLYDALTGTNYQLLAPQE